MVALLTTVGFFLSRTKKRIVDDMCSLLGSPKVQELTALEVDAYAKNDIHLNSRSVLVYPKVQIKHNNTVRVVCASSMSRATKRDDSCVLYSGKSYGIVQKIVAHSNDSDTVVSVVLKRLTIVATELCNDPITHAKLEHVQVLVR